jgi:integrase/recombinase XerD
VKAPRIKDTLASRILDEAEVLRMLDAARPGRDSALLRLLYGSGVRVSEACGLSWADAQPRLDAGTITTLGKGGKKRTILLSARAWAELVGLRGAMPDDAPVFASRPGRRLDRSALLRIVKATAKRARIKRTVSPHSMRHAHASHALDRGAPIHVVQATLGHSSLATTSRYTHARPNDSSGRYVSA